MRNLPREFCSCDMEGELSLRESHGLSLKTPAFYQLCSLRQQNLAVDGLHGGYSSTGSEVAVKVDGMSSSRNYTFSERHYDTKDTSGSENVHMGLSSSQEEEGEEERECGNKSFEIHVYKELAAIRDKLKEQSQLLAEEEHTLREKMVGLQGREARLRERERGLKEREEKVCEMERLVCDAHDALTQCIEEEVTRRLQEFKEESVAKLSTALQDKTRENQRLRNSFDTIKQANDGLKKQLQEVCDRNTRLETQIASIQSRLTNLQRKNEYITTKQHQQSVVAGEQARAATRPEAQAKHKTRKITPKTSLGNGYYELLSTAMSWLSRVHLSQPPHTDQYTQQCCGKMLPLMADMLPHISTLGPKLQLPFLEFIYWAITHISAKQQKPTLTSTLRRIGEEIYKPSSSLEQESTRALIPKAFFRSSDLYVRLLSTLIVLKTLTQVDSLAHVFNQLQQDIKEDSGKEVFLTFRGVETVLPFMRPSNKALCGYAVDVCLQLAVESVLLPHFLAVCSTEEWFAASAALLKESREVDVRILEKLSIILQRLSKNRCNRRLFELFQLGPVLQGLLRTHTNSFLALNLQSILINLTTK